jgi:hypothetical protein
VRHTAKKLESSLLNTYITRQIYYTGICFLVIRFDIGMVELILPTVIEGIMLFYPNTRPYSYRLREI